MPWLVVLSLASNHGVTERFLKLFVRSEGERTCLRVQPVCPDDQIEPAGGPAAQLNADAIGGLARRDDLIAKNHVR